MVVLEFCHSGKKLSLILCDNLTNHRDTKAAKINVFVFTPKSNECRK